MLRSPSTSRRRRYHRAPQGWKWDPLPAFAMIATAITVVVILIYIAVCLGSIYYYWTRAAERVQPVQAPSHLPAARRDRFRLPALLQFKDRSPNPVGYANWIAIGWIAIGLIVTAWMALRPAAGARELEADLRGRRDRAPEAVPAPAAPTSSDGHRRAPRSSARPASSGSFGPGPRSRRRGRARRGRQVRRRTTASRADPLRGRPGHRDRLRAHQQRDGPIAVKGAEPGDSLVVELLEVKPIEWGSPLIPGYGQLARAGALPSRRSSRSGTGEIEMDERIRFPARPMVGVVGVATEERDVTNALPGQHGGNLDNHLHGGTARRSTSPFASRAGCSPWATCTRRWETARSADGRRDRRRGRDPLRPRQGEAGPLAGHRAPPKADRARHGIRVHGRDAARLRGGRADARRRVEHVHGGRLHYLERRLRRERSAGVQARAGLRDHTPASPSPRSTRSWAVQVGQRAGATPGPASVFSLDVLHQPLEIEPSNSATARSYFSHSPGPEVEIDVGDTVLDGGPERPAVFRHQPPEAARATLFASGRP